MSVERRVKVIFNPNAGVGRFRVDETALRDEFGKAAYRAGVSLDLDIEKTSEMGHCTEIAREAVRSGFDVIAAAGGDGTVMEAVNAIAGTGSLLGIVPIGSGNDTIVSIKGDASRSGCIEDIISGGPSRIDVGEMNGMLFLNVVGLGLDAEINHFVADRRSLVRKIGPALTYTYGALVVLMKFKPHRISVSVDGGDAEEHTVSLCTIGNGTTCGGGYRLTPRALMNDGMLDLSISPYLGKIRSVLNIKKAYSGKHLELEGSIYRTLRTMEVVGLDRELPYHIDGEGGYAERIAIRIIPGGLGTVHAPAGAVLE